jgi:hypothetical protein
MRHKRILHPVYESIPRQAEKQRLLRISRTLEAGLLLVSVFDDCIRPLDVHR